jgi:hypothetical protein
MQPWILEQVAYEHRRDLLAKADRWRLTHRRSAGAPAEAAVSAGGPAALVARPGLGWIWSTRRAEREMGGDAATTNPATAGYAS